MSRFATVAPRRVSACAFATANLALALGAQATLPTNADQLLAQQPARIVPNMGQWVSPELYRTNAGGLEVFLEPRGWSFWLHEPSPADEPSVAGARPVPGIASTRARAVAVRMTFLGAGEPAVVPEQLLPGTASYLVGADASRHRIGVPGFAAVLYRSLYSGVDVRVRTDDGLFEYDLLLAPGADLAQVRVHVDGASSLSIDTDGRLAMATPLGPVQQPRPRAWVVAADGARRPVECSFELRQSGFGFTAPTREPSEALVVDPPIVYSTFYGGSNYEYARCVVEDGSGRILISGNTQSNPFPTTVGVIQPGFGGGGGDGFVVLIDPSQPPATQVVFATYFGGTGSEAVNGVTVLPSGLIAFAGATSSQNLPVTPGAFQSAYAGGVRDEFVGTMTPNGGAIVSLTYLGGGGDDRILSLKATPAGNLLVCGHTSSPAFPVTANAYQATHAGGFDAHVSILDPLCTNVIYSTFLGGTGEETLECGGVDAAGIGTFHGASSSTNFPVTANAFQATSNGGNFNTGYWTSVEGVVVQLDPSQPPAQQLVYSTYLGGSGNEWCDQSVATSNGQIVCAGTASSTNFPTTSSSYGPSFFGGAVANTNYVAGDAFVVTLDPGQSGSAGMVWGTFFGSAGPDQGLDCTVDTTGEVTVVGWTQSAGRTFPTTPDALRRTYGLNKGFVVRLSSNGEQALYSSLLGGSNHDGAWLATNHADGQPTIVGATVSSNFPTVNPAQPTYAGAYDAFITRMSLIPDNTTRYGVCSGAGGRYPTIHALGDAVPGNTAFGLACSRAPANGAGILVVATQPAAAVPFFGISLNVDLAALAVTELVFADAAGEHSLSLTFPPVTGFYVQYLWLESQMPVGLSASDSLQL